MNSQIDNYKNKIEFENDKIKKLKSEIKDFKDRKEREILAAKERILTYEQSILRLQINS